MSKQAGKRPRAAPPAGSNPLRRRTLATLRRHGLLARKTLGQHFLVDEAALDRVVAAAGLGPGDTVVEVGPGLGFLTERLATRAGRVIAVELDERLAAILETTFRDSPKVQIVRGDVLRLPPARLAGTSRYKVVANLPYYITSAVMRHFLEAPPRPELMVVTVQKEVAEQIAAPPGRMSLLSVSVQLYGEPEVVAAVPASAFYPPPEVESAVLKVKVFATPRVPVGDGTGFFAVVRAGFSAARKQLGNSLAQGLGLPKEQALALLAAAGIDPRRRAETLALEEWARLWRAYADA